MNTILETRGICQYFGGLKALEGVDMSVRQGDVFGIIGPNGAGKTTFFNVCTGVYTPTAGSIFLDGEDITGLPPEQIARRGMARTFQNIKLFKFMSVFENINIGFHVHTKTGIWDAIFHTHRYSEDERMIAEKAEEILERVDLAKYRDVMAGNMSYGLQRRIEIARALALEPKVLLLDEPAAGMNHQETKELMKFIKKLSSEGYTIVVIEHDMKFVMNTCNRILVLNFGQRICEGTPDEILNNEEVHTAYFGSMHVEGKVEEADA